MKQGEALESSHVEVKHPARFVPLHRVREHRVEYDVGELRVAHEWHPLEAEPRNGSRS